jgi:hypothetical protein
MPPVVVYTSETDPSMIAKADWGIGPVQPKKSTGVPLPRLRPAQVPAVPAAVKPVKSIVIKTAEQTIQ